MKKKKLFCCFVLCLIFGIPLSGTSIKINILLIINNIFINYSLKSHVENLKVVHLVEGANRSRNQCRSKSIKANRKCLNYGRMGHLGDYRFKNINQETLKSNLLASNSNSSKVNIVVVNDSYEDGNLLLINHIIVWIISG